ncbi:kinesin [Naegleria gruberi]|uniref:Kinesin n=1 Tax=Naegleria gruberi TaxID=5762 RepID=D2VBC5_NAEGR|nr:kinesin [Naegleria gruberi]EFC45884.1 kinesin [Naegleria gruberi]|eukprot:XP_002678628.1 kinesin [Naegleria gruberi]
MRNNLNNLSGVFSPSQDLERMLASPTTSSFTTRRQNIQTPSFMVSPIVSRGGLFSPLPSLGDDETLSATNRTEIFSKDDDDKSSVRVVVRVRPLFDNETQNCIQVDPATKRSLQVISNNPKEKPKTFTFDHVASPTTTQKDMFEFCGKPIVDSYLAGYNGTIFCYGQTGSGKTFTMGTSHNDDVMEDDLLSSMHNLHLPSSAGLIPRVLSYIFSEIEKKRQQKEIKFIVSCSFLEIYNERITDLLDSTPKLPLFNGGTVSKSLNLREDIKSGVYVEQLIHEDIATPVEALAILKKGLSNRHVGSTSMNNQSSRSHSVFTIYMKSQETSEGGTKTRTSRLNLIDLAGSERQSTSNTEGDRLKEACSINKSLSTLGKVIKDLVDVANGISRHVQYRDSKLTFLLKDSLGGNSKTCVIANISPAINSLSESLSTLTFAQRAKRIKNEAKINEETSGSITFLQEQIKLLRKQLLEANKRVSEVPQTPTPQLSMDENEKEQYIIALQQQHVYLSAQTDEHEEKNSILTHRVEELKKVASSKDRLLTSTRFLLRLREAKIARLTGKSVKNPKQDFVSGLDFDFDRPQSPQKFSKFNFENFTLDNEEQFLSIADSALQKALSPEQHPDVIQLKIENMELKDQLNSYESQFSKQFGANKELFKELHSYIQSLELSIRHLTGEKEQLANKIQDMEKSHRRNSSILQEQVAISENQTLLGEITRLEQMYEESLETIASLKKDITQSQEKEQMAWSELESIKQLLEQVASDKENMLSENIKLKEERTQIEAMLEGLENQQMVQKGQEETIRMLEEMREREEMAKHEAESKLILAHQEIEALKQQLESTEQLFGESMQENEQSNEEISKLKVVIETLNTSIDTLSFREQELLLSISERDASIESLKSQLEEVKSKESMFAEQTQQKETVLSSQLEQEVATKCMLMSALDEKEKALMSSFEQIKHYGEANDKLKDSIQVSERDLAEMKDKYQSTIDELEQLNTIHKEFLESEDKSRRESEEQINSLQELIEALKFELGENMEANKILNEELEQSKSQFTDQISELTLALEKQVQLVNNISSEKDITLRELNEKLHNENIILKMKEAELSKLTSEIETLKINFSESEQNYESITQLAEESIVKLQDRENQLVEEIQTMNGKITTYIEENEKLKECARVSERELIEMTEKYQSALNTLQTIKSTHEDAINNLKQCLALEQERNDDLLQHLSSMGNTSEEEKKQLLENEEQLRREREEQINSLQELIEALKFELGENMEANKILNEELEQSKSQFTDQISELTLALEKQVQLVNNISSEKDSMFRELNDKLINENIELKLKETEISNLTSELESFKRKYSEVQQHNESITQLAEESIEKLQEREQEVQKLEEQVSNLETELDSKGQELNNSNQKLNSTLRQLEALKTSSDGASNENIKLLSTIESLEDQIKSKQNEIEQQLESIRSLQSGEEFTRLTEKLNTVEKKCESLVKTLQTERETLLRKESDLNDLRNNYDESKEQLSTLEKRSLSQQMIHEETLKKLKEKYKSEKNQLEASLESLRQKYADSVTEVNSLKEELESLRKDHEKIIGHNNHKQKIQYQLKIKRENDELRDELQRAQKELSDMKRQFNPPPRPALFGNTNFEKNHSPTEVPLRDRTSFYIKRGPTTSESASLPTPLNLNQSALTKDRPIMGRSKMLVSNITTRNFSPVDKENVEELKTPQTASLNTSSLFGGNRKRRNIGDSNPNETSALFDADVTESSTKKVKPTEVDEKPKFR